MSALLGLALLGVAAAQDTDEVRAQIDWQGHPAMHIPWPMFRKGLTDRPLNRRTWKHMLRQQVSEPALSASGLRLVLVAAMAAERARNPVQARRLIERQFDFVEAFVARHSGHYALARSPGEARRLLDQTDKIVLVHSVEGGHHLLWDPGDAAELADRGVAVFTLIHLRDRELGGAALLDRHVGAWINRAGARASRRGDRRGLTELGRERMIDLWDAGILVDWSHMSPHAIEDAFHLARHAEIPPVFTHGKLSSVHPDGFAIDDDQLVQVYALGGHFATGLSAVDIGITHPPPANAPQDVCWGTLEAFAWHHQEIHDVLWSRVDEILPGADPENLTETERTQLAVGWSSDWNGWLNHSRPVAGKKACRSASELGDPRPIDTIGVAHPGVLPDHWARVEERGLDLDPMLRSAERFLQLWEQARGER